MNKKIKVIELFNLISNKKQIPQKILYDNEEYVFNGESFVCCDHDTTPLLSEYNKRRLIEFLNDKVEILEDNTEEIEELLTIEDYECDKTDIRLNRDKINELVKRINYIERKINDN